MFRFLDRVKSVHVERLLSFTPIVISISAIIVLGDLHLQNIFQGGSDRSKLVQKVALGSIALSGLLLALGWVTGRKGSHVFRRELFSRNTLLAKSFVLSFQLAILLLIVTAHLALWKNRSHVIDWYRYGFLDKRWLFSVYWIVVSAFLIFPPLIHRMLISENLLAAFSWTKTSLVSDSPPLERTPKTGVFLKLTVALILSFFLFGPPWNIERTPLYIDFHEEVHLGPLQAVHAGYLPNIGPASQQYGPGAQLSAYAYMKLSEQFTLVGFREAQGTLFFLGFGVYAAIAFLYLGFSWGFLAILISLSVSPFHLTYWNKFGGFSVWGWPNPLRYLGVLFLVLALASILVKRDVRENVDAFVISIGWIWGMFAWVSPENLMMGATASGLFVLLLWATETTSLRKLVVVGFNVALGGVSFWLPILLFYWFHGYLGEYLDNTFLVGKHVLAGFSNIATSGSITNVPGNSLLFYGFTPFVILMGWSALYESFELSRPLQWNRVLLLALVSVSVANYFGSLMRTDIYHLLNVLISLPLLLAHAIKIVPSFSSGTRAVRFIITVALVAVTFFVAFYQYDTSWFVSRIRNPLKKYASFERVLEVPGNLESGSFARTGYRVLPEEAALEEAVTPRDDESIGEMNDFFVLFDEIGGELEGKMTYVHSIPGASPGLAYFLADITPPPTLLDPYTMVFSSDIQSRFLEHFANIIDEVDCIVSDERGFPDPEVELFLQAAPDAAIEQVTFRDTEIYIVCR